MSAGRDTDHRVRVNEYGEREVIHLDSCPHETHDFFSGDFTQKHEPMTYEVYTCPVGHYIDHWGFVDLDENHEATEPGEYGVVLEWYTPESMYEDAECNFYVKDALTQPTLSAPPSNPHAPDGGGV